MTQEPEPIHETDAELVEWLLGIEEGLSDRELEFILDMEREVLKGGKEMTRDQRGWAEGIARRKG